MGFDDPLGDRVKRYERVSAPLLTPRSPLFIRVDGKSFHTWARHMERPFDQGLMDAMVHAAKRTADQAQGFKLAYVASDEATFALTDFDTLATQGWFGYELSKVVSVSASVFTAHFNDVIKNQAGELAFFDSRAFTVPVDDAPNVFIWRQRDWYRNSLHMLAREHFSHAELHGKSTLDVHDMLRKVGVDWSALPPQARNGTFITREAVSCDGLGYKEIRDILCPPGDGE